jgi:hypothetical protein
MILSASPHLSLDHYQQICSTVVRVAEEMLNIEEILGSNQLTCKEIMKQNYKLNRTERFFIISYYRGRYLQVIPILTPVANVIKLFLSVIN